MAVRSNLRSFTQKLESVADLDPEERAAIERLPATIRTLEPGQDIVRQGDRPTQCCLIVEGFAFRYKMLRGGKRQILSFHIPGDIPDLQNLYLDVMDHSLGALVPTQAAFIPHGAIRDLAGRFPRVFGALWRETLVDAATYREWIVGLGRRSAYARTAHLLCELLVRVKAVGLTSDYSFALPLTQAELADALGLSIVHVNRIIQLLRSRNLVTMRGGKVTVGDWEGLRTAAEFDPAYLHFKAGLAV